MKLDILAFAAHPDDVELGCAGTIASQIAQGYKVGVVDFTYGELGTRGTPEIRDGEAKLSAKILKLSVRENLGFQDGFFKNDKEHQLEVIKMIRKYRPEILLVNAISDRHPDHGRASKLSSESWFKAGLKEIETTDGGEKQQTWRPKAVYHYIQARYIQPDVIVDVSDFWDKKMESLNAFKSQFYDPNSKEEDTFISSPTFIKGVEARAREFGQTIGVEYGEGFTVERTIGTSDLINLF
ncbi:MAG: bacillithiol biosynthesis deacetylase BshB1 [Cyclobacteriaceae bacterium]|nr:bacillithiol biosynthesis deacetylase BshB1 [Cyclobacteriaceae bacterium]